MVQPQETAKQCAMRIKQYLDWSNKEFQTRFKSAEQMADKRDILTAYTKPQFNLMTLFTSPSPYALEVIEALSEMTEGEPEPSTKVPAIQKPKLPPRTLAVHNPQTGEVLYKRSPKRDFSFKEQLFIRQADKRGVSQKELMAKFNAQFKPRTVSSIITKKYRIRKSGLTKER